MMSINSTWWSYNNRLSGVAAQVYLSHGLVRSACCLPCTRLESGLCELEKLLTRLRCELVDMMHR
jgi:hypothetical protein